MLLTVSGVARLVADAEVKNFEKTQLVTLRVATNERVKKGESWEDRPSFLTVKTWLSSASKLPAFLKKGQLISLTGKVEEERWETEGQKRSKIVVKATEIELVGGKSAPADTPAPSAPANPASEAPKEVDIDEDEIPF